MLAASLLAGCGPHILVEQSPTAHLPGNGIYAWGAASANEHIAGEENPRINNDIIAEKIQLAINTGLAQRGYRAGDKTTADWLVHYHAGLQKQTEQISEPLYQRPPHVFCNVYRCHTVNDWGFYGPPETITRTVTFHEGTLLLDIHDAKTGKLVWRGTLSDEVNINQPLNQSSLQKALDKMLQQLPLAPH
jgi:hypothetical protein